jgi:hypothetical protein
MRSKAVIPAVAVLASGLAACGGGTGSSTAGHRSPHAGPRPTKLYRVALTGAAEKPMGAPQGAGVAIIAFHTTSQVCWRFAHLHGFTGATSGHIYFGKKGRTGKLVVATASGSRLHHQGCISISPTVSTRIWSQPADYYVSVRSAQYPKGAVRGQL